MSIRAHSVGTRRRPWPYDAYFMPNTTTTDFRRSVKILLLPDKDGALISEEARTLDATAPVDYTYSSANPYKERTSEWQHLYGGFGQAVAPDGTPRRYWYGWKADLSVNGMWMKGPCFENHL